MRIWKFKMLEWLPHSLHISIVNEPNTTKMPSALTVCNSKQNIYWIEKVNERYTKMFRRKAFLHHYTSRGMDVIEFC